MTVDILIPTYRRPAALAVTLSCLIAQTYRRFRVIISDQTEDFNPVESGEVQAVIRVLRTHGHDVEVHKHLPRRGIAEQRQFLLDQATAPYVLYLDDDVILESYVVEQMLTAIKDEGCGFVGSALSGLSFINDIRPDEQNIELWDGQVQPEVIKPDTFEWERWRLHNAANIYHVQRKLELTLQQQRKYHVAWIGGCVMYDTAKLREIGGYLFWRQLPEEHCGEDVLVQHRLMALYGGCGVIPSGAYHQELPTTIINRDVPADKFVCI